MSKKDKRKTEKKNKDFLLYCKAGHAQSKPGCNFINLFGKAQPVERGAQAASLRLVWLPDYF